MGLPIKHRKKFVSHKKKWDKNTIVEEAVFVNDYALKNKKEIRKVELKLSKLKKVAKAFNKSSETKNSAEAAHFIEKLKAQGLLPVDATTLDEVLDITFRDVFERRLANIVYKKSLARTPNQARQFVVHGHVLVGGSVVTAPSFPVSVLDETTVEFVGSSSLADENHPERNGSSEEGLEAEMEKQAEITPNDNTFDADKAEAVMDDEEQDEVNE